MYIKVSRLLRYMRSLKTLVGFVLILGLLTLGVVGLDYLDAPNALKLAFAILLGAFGLIAFGIAITARPSTGTILASAAAVIALFVAIRDAFMTTLDLLLFALIIFDVIVLFVLFSEIDRFERRRTRAKPAPRAGRSTPAPTAKTPVQDQKPSTVKQPSAKRKTSTTARKATGQRAASTRVSRYVASKKREGGSFHTVNCYIARRIPQNERIYFATREEALKKGYKPCRICNP